MKDNSNDTTAPATTDATSTAEPDIMKLAAEADAAGESGETSAPSAATKPADATQATGTPPAEGESAEDKTSKTEKTDKTSETEKGSEAEKAKEESAFAKAKKDAERKDRSWKALDAEKEEFRQERARIESELTGLKRELSELRARAAKPAGPVKDSRGLTASDYDTLAKKFEREGNEELAQAAKDSAEELRTKAQAAEAAAPAGEPWAAPEFQAEWQKQTQALIAADPTLADPKNPVVGTANNLVNDPKYRRFFRAHPEGISAAVEVARLILASAEAKQLKAKYTELEATAKRDRAEVDRLNGLLQPRGSHPSAPPAGAKKLENMTDAEAEAFVRQAAAAADRG